MPEENKPWMVRDVPERTRRKVRTYSAEHGLTMAQALEQIVDQVVPDPAPAKEAPLMADARRRNLNDENTARQIIETDVAAGNLPQDKLFREFVRWLDEKTKEE